MIVIKIYREKRWLTISAETECPHRKLECQYCQLPGEYQFIEEKHKKECPKFPINCPNECEVGSIPREDMTAPAWAQVSS